MQQLLTQLNALKLFGMARGLSEQYDNANYASLSFDERLVQLLDREQLHRNNCRISRLLKMAKLRQSAYIEEVQLDLPRGLNKSLWLTLSKGEFIRLNQNVLITGPTGSGKSYLACALGQQACRLGYPVKYLRMPRLIEELRISHADGSYGKLLLQILKADLLILDDFGLSPIDTQAKHDLFNIIEDRHHLKSTIITAQLPVKHWHEYLGEPSLADALLDRLLEKVHRLELKGTSLRKAQVNNNLVDEE